VLIKDLPKSTMNLKPKAMAPNLPEQPTKQNSKFRETIDENLRFFKSLFYLTRKVFMI
jgi:hypothetical protein